MNEIWANRLVAGTKTWAEMPASRAARRARGYHRRAVRRNHWRGIRGMTAAETIERLTALVKEQADIIKEQADALAQLGAIAELYSKIEAAARERAEVLGE